MAQIGIIMGSKSDLPVMQDAIDILNEFGISTDVDIVSAHRTPEKMMDYGINAHKKGIKVIIAGAGGAAHLPGMIASVCPLPIIGGMWISESSKSCAWPVGESILSAPISNARSNAGTWNAGVNILETSCIIA